MPQNATHASSHTETDVLSLVGGLTRPMLLTNYAHTLASTAFEALEYAENTCIYYRSPLFFFVVAWEKVDYVDLEGKTYMAVPGHTKKPKYEFGTMTHFAYRVQGGEKGEELVVATTRLETMLGDTVSILSGIQRNPQGGG